MGGVGSWRAWMGLAVGGEVNGEVGQEEDDESWSEKGGREEEQEEQGAAKAVDGGGELSADDERYSADRGGERSGSGRRQLSSRSRGLRSSLASETNIRDSGKGKENGKRRGQGSGDSEASAESGGGRRGNTAYKTVGKTPLPSVGSVMQVIYILFKIVFFFFNLEKKLFMI